VIVETGPGSAGFSISGPISAADGEIGDILLSFTSCGCPSRGVSSCSGWASGC
jgi:hypothetical protein